ncbi:amylovoran biosynthesis protein AmsD [Polymorphobacter glacialis]|uniref:Amylovoran biosynthesis protein AmsD n=1 Tax=Sandarakinorhabdus glacialis TaxID=1614636 RepID=A0A916ZW93_9SPHN|nr:glycosyltransferase family 4 protein [Polymorphobacter glacialis]GGE14556.1 amylovoran biosynthesis protein AmsD [Polymorphobacter glacialis]
MHIAILLSSLGAGGAERVLALLTGHWTANGHRVTVIAFDSESDPVFHDFGAGVSQLRLGLPPGGSSPIGLLARRTMRLRRILRTERPDIVVSFLFKINVTTLIAAMGLGIPVIVSERNNPDRQQAHPIWPLLRSLFYPSAAALVLQTEASRKALSRSQAAAGVVIANPITCWPRRPEPEGRKTLVAVGRLDAQKGFDLLLQAFAVVAALHPAWDLVIWGEGPRRADLEAQVAALGIGDRASLPGLSDKPGDWIASASAFVLSSRFEGFGNAMAEAMAAGLPVVAFDCDYGVAVLADRDVDCLVVAPEDVSAMAAAIDRLLGDPALRHRLGTAASISARRFAAPAIFAQWDALLDNSVTGKPAQSPAIADGPVAVT